MLSSINSISIFLLILLITFVYVRRMGTELSRLFLSLCLGVFLGSLIETSLLIHGGLRTYPSLAMWAPAFILALGPLMYFFTRTALDKNFRPRGRDWLHFLPATLGLFILQISFQGLPYEQKQSIVDEMLDKPPAIIMIGTLVVFMLIGIYIFYSFKRIQQHEEKINQEYANTEHIKADWIREILLSFMFILMISLLTNIARFYLPDWWTASALINLLVFLFIGSRLLFKFADYRSVSLNPEIEKVFTASLQERTNLEQIAQNIEAAMTKEKHYLDPEITLKNLSQRLGLKPLEVSQSLNQIIGKNFFDYINHLRIEYTCELLKKYSAKEKNITEIMYESGFNSKSSFNTAFKKYQRMTPSEFRKGLGSSKVE